MSAFTCSGLDLQIWQQMHGHTCIKTSLPFLHMTLLPTKRVSSGINNKGRALETKSFVILSEGLPLTQVSLSYQTPGMVSKSGYDSNSWAERFLFLSLQCSLWWDCPENHTVSPVQSAVTSPGESWVCLSDWEGWEKHLGTRKLSSPARAPLGGSSPCGRWSHSFPLPSAKSWAPWTRCPFAGGKRRW